MTSSIDRKPAPHDDRVGVATGVLGLLTTVATGAACVGPFIAILLGVGGFGWLTRYAHLRVPATLLTVAVLAYGFFRLYGKRARTCSSPRPATARIGRVLLWTATVLAVGINVFEYVVLPRLGS